VVQGRFVVRDTTLVHPAVESMLAEHTRRARRLQHMG